MGLREKQLAAAPPQAGTLWAVVALVGLFAAAPGPAQTTVWSGTLTPADDSTPAYTLAGWTGVSSEELSLPGASMSKTEFTHDTKDYELAALGTVVSGALTAFGVFFDSELPFSLGVDVGTERFEFAKVQEALSDLLPLPQEYRNLPLYAANALAERLPSWTGGETVTLKLYNRDEDPPVLLLSATMVGCTLG